MNLEFPPIVSSLPEADVPAAGIRGWLLQGASRQAVFFRLEPGSCVPAHAHGEQWGFVIEGNLELTVSGATRSLGPGDSYLIPGGAIHSACSPGGALAMDLFADPSRFRTKP